nr:flagellin [Brevundimonas naejangsanensis]
MAQNSINTNLGALIALQNLNQTNRDLNVAQNRVNTGLKVATAKDNGAIFAIAAGQRAEMVALDAVKQSLQRGQSIVDVALSAGDTVMSALTELKSLAVAIQDAPRVLSDPADPASEKLLGESGKKLVADFDAIIKEIHTALAGATFDGANVFKKQTDDLKVIRGTKPGETFDIKLKAEAAAADIFAFGSTAVVPPAAVGDKEYDAASGIWNPLPQATQAEVDDKLAAYTVAEVEKAIAGFTDTLAQIGTKAKSLDRQLIFVSKQQDAMETGIGNLVDADMAKESARLNALQTKQQLGVQALAIANQAPSIILKLFQ